MASVVLPLFLVRLHGRFIPEYLDGLNRARGSTSYGSVEGEMESLRPRLLTRAQIGAGTLLYIGDTHGTRNLGHRPILDPVTVVALIAGLAFALTRVFDPVVGLMIAGLAMTFIGTVVITGDVNVLRLSCALPYLAAFAGFGAAGFERVFQNAAGHGGKRLARVALCAATGAMAYLNTTFIWEFWNSTAVRRVQRSQLAYLTVWLHEPVREGEFVLGASTDHPYVLGGHDGHWLFGASPPRGVVRRDLISALLEWPPNTGPVLLFAYGAPAVAQAQELLPGVLPEAQWTIVPDDYGRDCTLLYARLPGRPAALHSRLAALPRRP
jgi:hypothetical protein